MNMQTQHQADSASVAGLLSRYREREMNASMVEMTDAEVDAFADAGRVLLGAAAATPVQSLADAIAALDLIIKEHPAEFRVPRKDADPDLLHFEEAMGSLIRSVREFLTAQQQ